MSPRDGLDGDDDGDDDGGGEDVNGLKPGIELQKIVTLTQR